MSKGYAPTVAEFFWRPARPMGSGIYGFAGSMQSGTMIAVAADVREGRLCKLGFRAFACPHIIAACNRLAEQLEGAPVEALSAVSTAELCTEFEIPIEKAGKLLILQDAARACYADYLARRAAGR